MIGFEQIFLICKVRFVLCPRLLVVDFSKFIEQVLTSAVFDVFPLQLGPAPVEDYQYNAVSLHNVVGLNLVFIVRVQKVLQLKLLLWLNKLGCLRVLVELEE